MVVWLCAVKVGGRGGRGGVSIYVSDGHAHDYWYSEESIQNSRSRVLSVLNRLILIRMTSRCAARKGESGHAGSRLRQGCRGAGSFIVGTLSGVRPVNFQDWNGAIYYKICSSSCYCT